MPIITPAYPAMCATHNVTASTQMVMTEEFKKGADIVDKVIVGTAQWSELFAKHEFFHKYRYYLQVIASTGSAALQIKWYALALLHFDDLFFDLILYPGQEPSSLGYGN